MPRTILFCSQSASVIGGVEQWLEQLCSGLGKNWRPRVALVRGASVHDPDRFRRAYPRLDAVEIDGRGLPQESRVRAVMRCVSEIRPDIFVPLVVADAHSAAVRLRAASARSRYLLALHGNTALQLLHARELAPFVDLAVGPGRLTARLLAELGIPSDRVRNIPNGATPPVVERVPRRHGEPLRVGYVGRLTNGDKRVLDLVPIVEALSRNHASYTLTVAGDGPAGAELAERFRGHPVRMLGALQMDRLYGEVYPQLDVLLLCSSSEAFGIALVEAMQHGVVPVCSDFLGRASEGIVVHGHTGLVFPVGDAEAATGHLRRLATEEELLRSLSMRAKSHVGASYSWEACIEAWRFALEECLRLPVRCMSASPPARAIGRGRLEHLGLPAGVSDAIRRLRRRVFGVPSAMVGGEEWPWVPTRRSASELEEVRRLRSDADRSEDVNA